jgi:hypothetical protein
LDFQLGVLLVVTAPCAAVVVHGSLLAAALLLAGWS